MEYLLFDKSSIDFDNNMKFKNSENFKAKECFKTKHKVKFTDNFS